MYPRMSDQDKNNIGETKINVDARTKSDRYIWGTAFAILTIVGFTFPVFSTGNLGFFWTIAWWATLIFTIKPGSGRSTLNFFKNFLNSLIVSKKYLPSLGRYSSKLFVALIVSAIGYFLFQWIKGDVDIASIPLAQLTLNNLVRFASAMFVVFFFLKLIGKFLMGEDR